MRRRSLSLLMTCLALVLLASPEARASEAAVVTRTLNADAADVFQALKNTLEPWKFRKASLEEGIVKTSWRTTQNLRERYRERVVAEFQPDGYLTVLTIRHERQRFRKEMKTTITGPSAGWQDWPGMRQVAQDVARAVERSLGLETPVMKVSEIGRSRDPAAAVVTPRPFVVSPEVAVQVNGLKLRRRELVAEVKAIDARILDAVYEDRYEEIQPDVARLKAKKAAVQEQIAGIDREILALVLSDGDDV